MPIIYYDKSADKGNSNRHPALVLDPMHPCYRIVREAIDGKSVLHWNREQAYNMWMWWIGGYQYGDVVDEFGEELGGYSFKAIIEQSYYLVPEGKKFKPSDELIKDLYASITMEKKMLEAIENEEKEEPEET